MNKRADRVYRNRTDTARARVYRSLSGEGWDFDLFRRHAQTGEGHVESAFLASAGESPARTLKSAIVWIEDLIGNLTQINLPPGETVVRTMITLVHGGQTGTDRGAHEAAIANGWSIAGYMPRDQRDELGQIPPEVARYLVAIDKTSYAARTEANVRAATAALIIVRDEDDPRATPGTAKTIDLASERKMLQKIVGPQHDATTIARWIWNDLRMTGTLPLPLETKVLDPVPTRLLVAGPRESKCPARQAPREHGVEGVAG